MRNTNLAHLTPSELAAALDSAAVASEEQRRRDALRDEADSLAELEAEKQRRRELNALIERRRSHVELMQAQLDAARAAAPAARDRLAAAWAEVEAAAADCAGVHDKIRAAAVACQHAGRAQIRIDEVNGQRHDAEALIQTDGGMTRMWSEAGGGDDVLNVIPADVPREVGEVVRRSCGGVLYWPKTGLQTFFRR